jgi:hypothetical protein
MATKKQNHRYSQMLAPEQHRCARFGGKNLARQKIIDLFDAQHWPDQLTMLTLPGTHWNFERQLLAARVDLQTNFSCVERDREIFISAKKNKPNCAKFFFCDVDDFMSETDDAWDAAWLDYCGTLTIKRLAIIKNFYQGFVRSTLIVTIRRGRELLNTSITIDRAGGHSQWLRQHLHGDVLHDLEYRDTVAMTQFAVRHQSKWRAK